MSNEPKRKIHGFNFQSEGAHVALVDKAANLTEVLTMKAASEPAEPEVQISLTMKEFLQRFFYMWDDEASDLSVILGYGAGGDEYWDSLVDKVELLKSVDGNDKAPESVVALVQDLQKKFEKGKEIMDEKTIQKAVDAALAAQNEKHEADLKKALSEVETLKAREEARERTEIADVVKGWSLVDEADADTYVEALFKMRNFEGFKLVTALVEKAHEKLNAELTVEKGVTTTAESEVEDESFEADVRKALANLNKKAK